MAVQPYHYDVRQLSPASGPLSYHPGYLVSSALVDNYTDGWLALQIAGITYYVPPFTLGWSRVFILLADVTGNYGNPLIAGGGLPTFGYTNVTFSDDPKLRSDPGRDFSPVATPTGTVIQVTGPSGPIEQDKVKVSATDQVSDYLQPKIAAGSNVALAVLNPGVNESLRITVAGISSVFSVGKLATGFAGPQTMAGGGTVLLNQAQMVKYIDSAGAVGGVQLGGIVSGNLCLLANVGAFNITFTGPGPGFVLQPGGVVWVLTVAGIGSCAVLP